MSYASRKSPAPSFFSRVARCYRFAMQPRQPTHQNGVHPCYVAVEGDTRRRPAIDVPQPCSNPITAVRAAVEDNRNGRRSSARQALVGSGGPAGSEMSTCAAARKETGNGAVSVLIMFHEMRSRLSTQNRPARSRTPWGILVATGSVAPSRLKEIPAEGLSSAASRLPPRTGRTARRRAEAKRMHATPRALFRKRKTANECSSNAAVSAAPRPNAFPPVVPATSRQVAAWQRAFSSSRQSPW